MTPQSAADEDDEDEDEDEDAMLAVELGVELGVAETTVAKVVGDGDGDGDGAFALTSSTTLSAVSTFATVVSSTLSLPEAGSPDPGGVEGVEAGGADVPLGTEGARLAPGVDDVVVEPPAHRSASEVE